MTSGSVAAVDFGATSGRVILGRVGPGVLETETIARFPNEPVFTAGTLRWDILSLYSSALSGLRRAIRAEPDVRSIGIDSWAVDYGLLRSGQLVGNPFHYRDERTARGVEAVHAALPHAELYPRNGLQFLPFNTLYQLAAEDEDTLAFADQLLLIPDLVAYWLTGQARAELTNASTTGLLPAGGTAWDAELITTLGLSGGLLPSLIAPGETLAPLQPAVAQAVGAAVDVVAVGSHDTASAVVAVPMDSAHAAYISCGTWGLVGVELSDPILTEEARTAGFTNEGGVDGRVRLLRNVMGLWILTETVRGWERAGDEIVLTELLDAAARVPADSVPLFDVNDPSFLPPGDMPARIDAWCAERGMSAPATRAEYARSIIESLAQGFADAVRAAADLGGVDVRTIHIVGGGALNTLLCQRTADRSGTAVLAGPVEATALGNVLIQARAAGLVSGSLEDLRELVARTHEPTRYTPR